MTMDLKKKLETIWRLKSFKLILLREGVYHVLLRTIEYQSSFMAQGVVYTSPVSSGCLGGIQALIQLMKSLQRHMFRFTLWIPL